MYRYHNYINRNVESFKLLYEASESKTCRNVLATWYAMAYHHILQFQFGAVGETDGIQLEKVF